MIFIILITSIGSIPSIIISGIFDGDMEDTERVLAYQDIIFAVDRMNREWIDEMKSVYDYCDEFEINYNYNLTWYELISIDSVLLNQDFRKMDINATKKIALEFLDRTVKVIEIEVEEDMGHKSNCSDNCNKSHKKRVKRKICIITVDTKSFEEVLSLVGITKGEDISLALNIYDTVSTMDIEGNLNIYDTAKVNIDDLQEYPEGNASLPYYNQTDARWGGKSYGNTTILDGGCGPTSLAMVVSGLTGQKVTPDIVADWSYRNGHRAEGQGSYWSLMTEGGKYYGLNVEQVSRKNSKAIVKALSEGYPVVASMGKGHFTNGGHFIVLSGITSDGKILVHDSASIKRSKKEWDLSIIMKESSVNGGVNGSPFWIFKP
ncbi:C39 family peptidase [Tissierella praeacuta]|uniref:C39 family peptidase n=1 Tax=Tissierella praeacuta TaxID=43131 RepID=UPI0028A6BB72|nr:C39 family peptidase [Tissierella praeacuta]